VALKDLDFRDAEDPEIFFAARKAGAVVMTKDGDFVDLVLRHGSPPQVLWITCGNTSNRRLQEVLTQAWPTAVALLDAGERLVEIGERTT